MTLSFDDLLIYKDSPIEQICPGAIRQICLMAIEQIESARLAAPLSQTDYGHYR